VFIVLSCFSLAVAGGDHGDSGSLDHKVPVEGKSGLNLWLAVLYNDNRFLFAVVVTFTMAALGMAVGYISNLALRRLGLK
jgi:hypothetical protein